MKIQKFLGQIVLAVLIIWIVVCAFVFVLKETGAIDPPHWPLTIETTMFIMALIGMAYSINKLANWIENGPKGDESEEGKNEKIHFRLYPL